MLLENKNAVIYGGGGAIGGAVARSFAREGASVFLAGRTEAKLIEVADDIRARGGLAETTVVDALDEEAVDRHADTVAAEAGGLDISFNLITHPHKHGVPFHEMEVDDFMAPVEVAARTTFITARAAARHMIPRRSGVILALGGPGDRSGPLRDYHLGGTQVEGADQITKMITDQTLLGRAATLEDIGNAAVFAASDWARSVTAAIVNVSCGALID
jgi:3-oxoacyl-[acyl-carrier protein] reductase